MTPHEILAERNLKKLSSIVEDYEALLTPEDVAYVKEYIDIGYRLLKHGAFHDDRVHLLEHMPWSDYNFRYGAKSIYGVCGEIVAIGLINKRLYSTAHLNLGNKEMEMSGVDLYITNPNWRKKYTGQVKTVSSVMSLMVQDNWRRYSSLFVDRLILVQPNQRKMIEVDFGEFVKRFHTGDFIKPADLAKVPQLHLKTIG